MNIENLSYKPFDYELHETCAIIKYIKSHKITWNEFTKEKIRSNLIDSISVEIVDNLPDNWGWDDLSVAKRLRGNENLLDAAKKNLLGEDQFDPFKDSYEYREALIRVYLIEECTEAAMNYIDSNDF